VSVAGPDTYADGSTKFMGGMLRNDTKWMVYVQNKASRVFDLAGPVNDLQIGDDATFTWESEGYGDFFCFVDGGQRPARDAGCSCRGRICQWHGPASKCRCPAAACMSEAPPRRTGAGPKRLPPCRPTTSRFTAAPGSLSLNSGPLMLPRTFSPGAGKRVYNLADKAHCESPLTLKLKDTLNHTLDIVLVDVCKKQIKKAINFGNWGWALNTTGEPPAPPPGAPEPPADTTVFRQFNMTTKKNGVQEAAPRLFSLLAVLLAMLAALF
jgi:hypothetical protein